MFKIKPMTKIATWGLIVLLLFTACAVINDGSITDDISSYDPGQTIETTTSQQTTNPATPTPQTPSPKGTTSLRIRAVGDIMMHSPQIAAGKKSDGTYDFKHFFEEIKPYLEDADITIGNLEITIGDGSTGYSGYPLFKSPESFIEALVYAGFNVITTANNHSFDGREFGVTYTLDMLDKYGLMYTGTARSMEERQRILMVEKNDIKVAILAYTYGTNGMEAYVPSEKLPFLVNYIDKPLIKQDIERAREAGAEIIVANMHWGAEYARKPNAYQIETADYLVSLGVDIILGSHPHVLQPMERRRIDLPDGGEKEIFIIYSMGNFISNQNPSNVGPYTDSGVIVEIEIVKDYDAGTIGIGETGYIPTWVHRFRNNGRSDYNVLPVYKYREDGLSGDAGNRIRAVWGETTNHLGDGVSNIIE